MTKHELIEWLEQYKYTSRLRALLANKQFGESECEWIKNSMMPHLVMKPRYQKRQGS